MNFKRNLKNNSFYLGIILIIIGLSYFQKNNSIIIRSTPVATQTPKPVQTEIAKVTKVFDGDTIEIEGGIKVRYIGIDSSEIYPEIQCFSQEAKKENEKLVLGKAVSLVKDNSETDKYGRLLRYVYVEDDFINNDLVKRGFAKIMTVSPDIRFEELFLESQKYAKENNLGLWGKCL